LIGEEEEARGALFAIIKRIERGAKGEE